MSNRLLRYLRSQGLIDDSNDKIISYGLRRLYLLLIDTTVILVCSYLFGNLWAGLLFDAAYSTLRIYAGGFHANTEKSCFTLSYSCIFLCLLFIFYAHISSATMSIAYLIIGISVAIMSPVEHENKPLYPAEKKAYRKKCLFYLIVDTCTYILLLWNHLALFAKAIFAALALICLSQWVAVIQKRRKRSYENENEL